MTEIYVLIKDGEIVYVGKSKDSSKRVKDHKKDKDFDSYMVVCKCRKEAEKDVEDMYIKQFNPIYNRALNSVGQYTNLYSFCEKHDLPEEFISLVKRRTSPIFSDNYITNKLMFLSVSYENEKDILVRQQKGGI